MFSALSRPSVSATRSRPRACSTASSPPPPGTPVYRGELAELHRRSIGPDLVFGHLWRETGCQAVLHRHLAGRRFGFDGERAIYLTVVHRLMVSGSDRHASPWQQTFETPGAKDLT